MQLPFVKHITHPRVVEQRDFPEIRVQSLLLTHITHVFEVHLEIVATEQSLLDIQRTHPLLGKQIGLPEICGEQSPLETQITQEPEEHFDKAVVVQLPFVVHTTQPRIVEQSGFPEICGVQSLLAAHMIQKFVAEHFDKIAVAQLPFDVH